MAVQLHERPYLSSVTDAGFEINNDQKRIKMFKPIFLCFSLTLFAGHVAGQNPQLKLPKQQVQKRGNAQLPKQPVVNAKTSKAIMVTPPDGCKSMSVQQLADAYEAYFQKFAIAIDLNATYILVDDKRFDHVDISEETIKAGREQRRYYLNDLKCKQTRVSTQGNNIILSLHFEDMDDELIVQAPEAPRPGLNANWQGRSIVNVRLIPVVADKRVSFEVKAVDMIGHFISSEDTETAHLRYAEDLMETTIAKAFDSYFLFEGSKDKQLVEGLRVRLAPLRVKNLSSIDVLGGRVTFCN